MAKFASVKNIFSIYRKSNSHFRPTESVLTKEIVKPKLLRVPQQPKCNFLAFHTFSKPLSAVFSAKKFELLKPNVYAGVHDWQRQREQQQRLRKIVPSLIYFYNPVEYLITKLKLWRLRLFWDATFRENEFIRGAKKAAVVLSKIMRSDDLRPLKPLTTPTGYCRIQTDVILSINDVRFKMLQFETEHLRKAIPLNVVQRQLYAVKYCFIDVLFVCMRNTKDFETAAEVLEFQKLTQLLDFKLNKRRNISQHRVLYAEVYMRFRRNYSGKLAGKAAGDNGWSAAFYKILDLRVVNYNPDPIFK